MNKVMIAIIGATVTIAAAAGAFLLMRRPSSTPSPSPNSSDAMMEDGRSFSGSFLDLLALGQNYTCTFDTTDDTGNKTQGVAYVAVGGDKLNGQFTITQADGSVMDGNVIRDGEYNYVWTSLQEEGFKMKITPEDQSLFGDGEDLSESTGMNDSDQVNFDCKPWNVDNARFVPPQNITFVDASEAMKQLQENPQGMENLDCSVCDQVPAGSARDQCLQAIGC